MIINASMALRLLNHFLLKNIRIDTQEETSSNTRKILLLVASQRCDEYFTELLRLRSSVWPAAERSYRQCGNSSFCCLARSGIIGSVYSSSPSTFSACIGSSQVPQTNCASGFAHAFNPHSGQVYFVLLAAFFFRVVSFSLLRSW
jgi:hypothetical protein